MIDNIFFCSHVQGSGWAIVITCRPSSVAVRPSYVVRPSTPLNDFHSVTSWPIFFKLHVEPSVEGWLKIYTNRYGLFIKLATMPIYGKNTWKSSSPEPRKLQGWILVYSIMDLRSTKFVQMITLCWPLIFFYGEVIFASPCIYMGKMLKIY